MENDKQIITPEIVTLLSKKYQDTSRYVCAREVANAPGSLARRWLDFVVVDCWPSAGLKISAFEIKVSKSDFRHELLEPKKHNIFFDEIDNFSIVAPDYVLDDIKIIPPKWGIYHVVRDATGELQLKTVRKPLALSDDPEHERKIGRGFMASLCRAINKQSVVRAALFHERNEMEARIREKVEQQLANGRIVTQYDYDELKRLRSFCRKLGISFSYGDISEWEAKHFRQAFEVVTHLNNLESRLKTEVDKFRYTYKTVKDLMDSIAQNGGDPSALLNGVSNVAQPETPRQGKESNEGQGN